MRVRSLEANGKMSEKVLRVSELPEFFLQQRHGPERSESVESQSTSRVGGGPSASDSFPSNARPPVNVTVLSTSKLSGHFKRKIHDAVSPPLSIASIAESFIPFQLNFFASFCVSKFVCLCVRL